MTRADIKAELRRSACEDARPLRKVSCDAFEVSCEFIGMGDDESIVRHDDWRTFFLLVAEAL